MTNVYDPTAVEVPKIKLLGKTYELAKTGLTRLQRVNQIQEEIAKLKDDDFSEEGLLNGAALTCQMIEASLKNADGLADQLLEEFKKDNDDASMEVLERTADYLQRQQQESLSLGNE